MWQLDDLHIKPDIALLKHLHNHMCQLLSFKFSQTEIITGNYSSTRTMRAGIKNWAEHENIIKKFRGSGIFDFASFMLYSEDEQKL